MTDQMTKGAPILITQNAATTVATTSSEAETRPAGQTVNPTTIDSVETGPSGRADPCSCSPGRVNRMAQLIAAAEEAAQVRELTTRPDVVAFEVDRVRAQVDALLWAGIMLGLLFTTVNVQQFAAGGAAVFSAGWWVAWLLDPMVSLVLLAVLRAEQVTARYQVTVGAWPRRTKWCAFVATYLMNTWTSWGLNGEAASVSGVVLHSVPPLLVVLSAETGPVLRDRLTEAARRALVDHDSGREDWSPASASVVSVPIGKSTTSTEGAVHAVASPAVHRDGSRTVHEGPRQAVREPASGPAEGEARETSVREQPSNPARPRSASATGQRQSSRRRGRRTGVPRRLLADYLAEARAALADAAATGQRTEPTPTWCRQTTGCSAGTSVKLAAALRRAAEPPDGPDPDGRSEPNRADAESALLKVDQPEVDHGDPKAAA